MEGRVCLLIKKVRMVFRHNGMPPSSVMERRFLLDFEYEISGQADIIVRERRLVERLFDNLRYRTK
jgi:hypothetical protein